MSPLREPLMDGAAALDELVKDRGVVQFLADNTVFLHPDTVAQTNGEPLFRVIRDLAQRGKPGKAGELDVICCDNDTPTRAFLWAAGRSRGRDVQFNHIWTASGDPQLYTALWNLCATPAFLAKLTDGKGRPDTVAALQYRAFELYGYSHGPEPAKPDGYDSVVWRDTLEPVEDLQARLRERLRENPKSRAALSARIFGWLFSRWEPDPSVGFDAGASTL